MGLRISTNLSSLAAQRHLVQSGERREQVMKALASGKKYDDKSTGSAEFTLSEHLRGQIAGLKSGQGNAESAGSFIAVAEGGLNEQNNILIRLRELAIQASSDTFSENEREMVDMEFQQLVSEFDRIAKTTTFGSNRLLDGTEKEYEFQVGAYKGDENIIRYKSNTNTTASEMNIDGLAVLDKDDARDSLETLDEALGKIGQARANFGAIQSRLQSVVNNAGIQIENLSAAQSRYADTDYAASIAEMFQQQALQQFQTAVLAQANQQPLFALKLLG